jgi:hypothetical protein
MAREAPFGGLFLKLCDSLNSTVGIINKGNDQCSNEDEDSGQMREELMPEA